VNLSPACAIRLSAKHSSTNDMENSTNDQKPLLTKPVLCPATLLHQQCERLKVRPNRQPSSATMARTSFQAGCRRSNSRVAQGPATGFPAIYQTIAGFLLQQFGAIPTVGEHVDVHGWRFEIVDLDGGRIDKVLATPHLELV
jgi:hypothetical protein